MKTKQFMLALSLFALVGCNINSPIDVTKPADVVYGKFTDPRDGNVYKTIKIGNQTWMAENLRYLPEIYPYTVYSSSARYYVYDYKAWDLDYAKKTALNHNNIGELGTLSVWETFGVLYNEAASKTAAPKGWRIPTEEDIQILLNYIEANCPGNRSEEATSLLAQRSVYLEWGGGYRYTDSPYFASSGFDLLPGGKVARGYCEDIGANAYLWLQGKYFDMKAYMTESYYYNDPIKEPEDYYAYSIRCIKE